MAHDSATEKAAEYEMTRREANGEWECDGELVEVRKYTQAGDFKWTRKLSCCFV